MRKSVGLAVLIAMVLVMAITTALAQFRYERIIRIVVPTKDEPKQVQVLAQKVRATKDAYEAARTIEEDFYSNLRYKYTTKTDCLPPHANQFVSCRVEIKDGFVVIYRGEL